MGGSPIRIACTIQSLATEFDVVVICSERDSRMVDLARQFCLDLDVHFHHDPMAFAAQPRPRITRRVINYVSYISPMFEALTLHPLQPDLADIVRSSDLVWVFKLGPIASRALPATLEGSLVVDLDDLEDQIIAKNSEKSPLRRKLFGRRIRFRRNRVLRTAQAALVCSSIDSARLHAPCRVEVLPNTYPSRRSAQTRPSVRESKVVVIGIMSYRPNRQGTHWFLDTCWDLVRSEVPDAQLTIAGVNSDTFFHTDLGRGVQVIGTFEDTNTLLRDASAVIVPVHYGSGTRIKLLEALSYGVPVVSTTVGAEGIDVEHGTTALIADTPHDFTRCVIDVLNDQTTASALSNAGKALFEAQYSPDVFERTVLAITHRALAHPDEVSTDGRT
jgi:glycosyltransferase involved in cell wall biosynthesis